MNAQLALLVLLFILLLFVDRYLRHFLAKQVILFGFHAFNSHRAGFVIYALLFLPGTIIHELAHLFAALLFGLGVGKVRLVPEKIAIDEPLGSVEVAAGNPFKLSFVGFAPFFAGLVAILTILSFISLSGMDFSVSDILNSLLLPGFYLEILTNLFSNLASPLNLVLVYLAVSISNHMYPSKVDLRYWYFQLISLILFAMAIYGLNQVNWFGFDINIFLYRVFPILYLIFIFTIILNLVLSLSFFGLNRLIAKNV